MNMKKSTLKGLLAVSLLSTTSLSFVSYAQEAEADDVKELDTVIVTSTKRSQSVTEVPYNITAFGGDVLDREGVTDIATLSRRIPGVVFLDKGPRSAGAFANSISMRGLNVDQAGNSSDRPGNTAPTVATYVGNVPVFTSIRLKDLDRVEVLRGPQGTLYGSGAMGGVVQLVPNAPSLDETIYKVSTRFSQTDGSDGFNTEGDFLFNVPFGDKFAVRGNVGLVKNDGFIDVPEMFEVDANGVPVAADPSDLAFSGPVTFRKDDVNDEDTFSGRIAFLFQPTDTTSATLTYHTQSDEVGARQGETPGLDDYEFAGRIEEPYERDVDIVSLDVESDLGFATMTVAAAHTETDGTFVKDNSGSYSGEGNIGIALGFPDPYWSSGVDLYTAYYGNNPRFVLESVREWDEEVDTFEARLASNPGDLPIDWVVGATYTQHEFRLLQEDSPLGRNAYIDAVNNGGVTLVGLDGAPAVGPGYFTPQTENDLGYFFDNMTDFEEIALFGELTYHVTDAWQVTGGIRYFDQEVNATQEGGLLVSSLVETNSAVISADDVLFKFNTSYDITDDIMMFFTYSEGFRRGGVNAVPEQFIRPARGEALLFEADELTSYEFGVKGRLFGDLTYTLTAFDVLWENAQFNTNLTFLALVGAANLPEAQNQGLEAEIGGFITDSLSFNVGYTYVDTEVTESVEDADRLAIVGSQLPIPKNTASANVTYFQDLGSSELVWSLNASYKDDTPSGLEATRGPNARRYQVYDSFTLLDGSVTWQNGPLSVSGFINNITNEKGVAGGDTVGISAFAQYDAIVRPRTIGIGLSYEFGH